MIRTVLGDIEKTDCANTLIHEHIQNVSNDMLFAFGNRWLDEKRLESYAVSVLSKLKTEIGLGVFVDGTAVDLGRNVRLLRRISQKTGVHIIASSGFYYYPAMISCQRSAEDLAYWILCECENGMEGTEIKPGILKCAADSKMTSDMEKRITAVSVVQSKTGLPMYAHCSHTDNIAYQMMNIFDKNNVNPEKTILGHASQRLDSEYLERILKYGYYISIDQSFGGDEDKVARVVYELCKKGYAKKLLFSHDRPIYNDFEAESETGLDMEEGVHIQRYSYLQNRLIPAFEKYGITDSDLFLKDNALDVLDF